MKFRRTLPPGCSKPPRAPQAAFTLVEIALSLGIVSFCLVSVMALMPIGMNLFATSRKEAAARRIAVREIAQMRNLTWPELSNVASQATPQPNYYTIDGDPVAASGPWIFVASTLVSGTGTNSVPGLENAALPGDTDADSYLESNLRRVMVRVAYSPEHANGNALFSETSDIARRGDLFTIPFVIANQKP